MSTRRRRGVRVRRQVRRLELWPVAKLALAFHLACAVVTMGALVVVWLVGRKLGTVDRVAKFLEDVGFARDFEIRGPVLFRGATAVAGVLVLVNTVGTVVLAFLYNSLSGLLGGLVFSVLEEQSPRSPATTKRDRRKHQSAAAERRPSVTAGTRPEGVVKPGEHQSAAAERRPSVSAGTQPEEVPQQQVVPALGVVTALPSSTAGPEEVTDDWLQAAREATP